MCFLTVNKRVHDRFFIENGNMIKNANKGTAIVSEVVQHGIEFGSGKSLEKKKDKIVD